MLTTELRHAIVAFEGVAAKIDRAAEHRRVWVTAAVAAVFLTLIVVFSLLFRLNDVANTNKQNGQRAAVNAQTAKDEARRISLLTEQIDGCLAPGPGHDCYERSQTSSQFFRDQIAAIRQQLDRLESKP